MALAAGALAACDSAPASDARAPGLPSGWSALRDALTIDGEDPLPLARARDAEPRDAASAPAAPGASAVTMIDGALARAGEDALVAARYTRDASRVVARSCGPLFDERDGVALERWLTRCGGEPASTRVEVVRGLPTLAAWLPDEARVLVHPALSPRSRLGTVSGALVDGGTGCLDELAAWCARCPTGAEPGCAPLFGGGAEVVSCATLDAQTPPGPGSSEPPRWRTLYCAWRALEAVPHARLAIAAHDFWSADGVACWDPSASVLGLDGLFQALPWWSFECDRALAAALAQAEGGVTAELRLYELRNQGLHLGRCAEYLEGVYCAACADDREQACVPLFESSAASTDCHDLARGESHGGGFAAYCGTEYIKDPAVRGCYNAYDACVGATGGLGRESFEGLILSFPGFFDRHTVERCIAQAVRCEAGDPLPDFDETATVPTPATGGGDTPESGDAKCPL